ADATALDVALYLLVLSQLRFIKARRQLAQLEQPRPLALGLQALGPPLRALLRGLLWNIHPRPSRQVAGYIDEGAALKLHEEAEHVPRLLTAKTVEELLAGADVEARRFLLVEWTQAQVVYPGSPKGHVLTDDRNNIRTIADLRDLAVRNQTQVALIRRSLS